MSTRHGRGNADGPRDLAFLFILGPSPRKVEEKVDKLLLPSAASARPDTVSKLLGQRRDIVREIDAEIGFPRPDDDRSASVPCGFSESVGSSMESVECRHIARQRRNLIRNASASRGYDAGQAQYAHSNCHTVPLRRGALPRAPTPHFRVSRPLPYTSPRPPAPRRQANTRLSTRR